MDSLDQAGDAPRVLAGILLSLFQNSALIPVQSFPHGFFPINLPVVSFAGAEEESLVSSVKAF